MESESQILPWYKASLQDMNKQWHAFQFMVYNLPPTQTLRPTRLCRQYHAS